ncbi:MAG TPA: hypothetical protein VE995_08810, partial [Gaiellaceae bacterium]|nr:hypothetical protein [Gaiellaceae bacterium]
AAGAWPGDPEELMDPSERNERGYFERRATAAALDGLLLNLGGSWARPPLEGLHPAALLPYRAILRGLIADLVGRAPSGSTPLLKDPRLCLFASELGLLLDSTAVFVLALRHPLEVARSLRAAQSTELSVGLALWELYNVAVCAGLAGRPVHVVRYDQLLEDDEVLEALLPACLGRGGELPRAAFEAAAGFLSSALRHERVDAGDERAWLWPPLGDLWHRLSEAASQHRAVPLPDASLSPIAQEILLLERGAAAGDAAPRRPAAGEPPAVAADDTVATVARLAAELAEAQRALERAGDERAALEGELAAARAGADRLVRELAERQEEHDRLRAEHDRLRAEHDRRAAELAQQQAALDGAQAERARLAAELAEARQAAEDLTASLAARQADLEQAQARAEALADALARARAGHRRLAAELDSVDAEAADWRSRARVVLARARALERDRDDALRERDAAARKLALARRELEAERVEAGHALARARALEAERAEAEHELLLERDLRHGFLHSLRALVGHFHPDADPAAFGEPELVDWARTIEEERERLVEANEALLVELEAVNRHRERLVSELEAVNRHREALVFELSETRRSESWRIGRALTWIVRVGLRRDRRRRPPL